MYKFKLSKGCFFTLIFFSFLINSIVAEDAILHFGGKHSWNNLLYSKNVKIRNGKFGEQALGLSSETMKFTEKTDAYISFDFNEPIEETGSYSLIEYSTIKTDAKKAKFGEGSALCSLHSKKEALRLRPVDGSFFAGNSSLKSFTIEFWLYPQITENGSSILKWWSSLTKKRNTMYQNIIASILNNKLEWSFLNIWHNENEEGLTVSVRGNSNLIPEKWSHHLITYNENTGCLEYRMNGRTEDLIYLTKTGRENSQVFHSVLGAPSDVLIGSNYSGLIDELKITTAYSEPNMPWQISGLFEKLPVDGGRIETNIIDTGGKKSKAKKLIASYVKPNQTDIEFFIRSANSPFNWTEEYPKWKTVKPGEKIKDVQGQFFQLACDIYPDADGQKSPILNSFYLEYDKNSRPLPPAKIFAKGLNSAVKLSWTPSINFGTQGYLIYFGEKKGEYFSEGSPINVGNVTEFKINNLQNGKIYFFTIASYDDKNATQVGTLSKEVWARPLSSKDD